MKNRHKLDVNLHSKNLKNLNMEYGLFDLFTLAGALVLFLFGMKMMSESLLKVLEIRCEVF